MKVFAVIEVDASEPLQVAVTLYSKAGDALERLSEIFVIDMSDDEAIAEASIDVDDYGFFFAADNEDIRAKISKLEVK